MMAAVTCSGVPLVITYKVVLQDCFTISFYKIVLQYRFTRLFTHGFI